MHWPPGGRRSRVGPLVVLCALAGILAACGGGSGGSSATSKTTTGSASKVVTGGSLTVLENSADFDWPTGLDPATDTEAGANAPYFDAIYGDLFVQGSGTKVVGGLAKGYSISDGGKTVTISLRKGMTFQDGTPFDAKAVAFNIRRDLEPKYACACRPDFPVSSVTTPDSTTVVLHLSHVFAPIMEAFVDSPPNWIVSPTALSKMGEKAFAAKPVGAGPFEVVSDQTNYELKLKKFPGYFQKGHPYLSSLTYETIGDDESAYEALLTGQGQVYQGLTTQSLKVKAQKSFTVTPAALTEPYVIQLNTAIAPFNNILAREAIYYATNVSAIDKGVANNAYPITESPTGPAGLFYEPKVPGYRTYDLAKAKALVQQLGGLTVTLGTINETQEVAIDEALSSQWAQAGIKTTLDSYGLEPLISAFKSNKWQAMLQSTGALDPALGLGLSARFASNAPFTGIHDPALDKLINEGSSTVSMSARAKIYKQAFAYIAQKAYAPFLFTAPLFYTVVKKTVSGPGLTTSAPQISWADVYVK